MKVIRQALLLLLLSAGAAVGAFYFHPRAPALYAFEEPARDDEVTLAQIRERWKGDVLWLDARPNDQFDRGHVPGAALLNEQHFDEQVLAMLDTLQTNTKPVIIYCGGEKCEASRKMRGKLLQIVSLDECYVLKGGWPAWKTAQGK